jgi:nucleoside-diphosphate-sugar epimerase
MKIVISGSEGFIGSRLKDSFKENSDIELVLLDIQKGHDLTIMETLPQLTTFDVFIHLAGLSFVPDSFRNPKQFYNTNINSTINALELCREHNAKMIFISSYVYGEPDYLPIDESHPRKAFNPYAQSKIIGEELCEGYNRDFDVPCIVLRPFNIYGVGQNETSLLPSIISQIKSGDKIIQLKDPKPRRDFVYIDDVVEAIKLCALKINHFGTDIRYYNIASGKSISVYELTELITSNVDTSTKLCFKFADEEKRKNEVNETVGSFKRINGDFGWKPLISLNEGLKKLLSY